MQMFKTLITEQLNYLDPISGSFIIQAIGAAAITALVYIKSFKNYIKKILLDFRNRFKK